MRELIPISRRDLRLASGLVLFGYVTLHLGCHALGLVSLEAAEAGLRATLLLWHSLPGTLLLYGAAAVHVGLALLAVYERRSLRMVPLQGVRIVLGLVMPLALIGHFIGTRYAFERFGLASEYSRVAAGLWATGAQGLALGLLAPGWVHGCLGLHFAFGARRGWRQLRLVLFGAALLLPVLAALGFVVMGRELVAERAGRAAQATPPSPAHSAFLADMRDSTRAAYLGLIGLVMLARVLRGVVERRRRSVVRISYPGRSVSVPRGWSVLEASRSFGIAHQSVCGGRGRCSTCRVRVLGGEAHCPASGIDEQRTLDRIDAAATVRLACQLRPTGDIAVVPLLAVESSPWRAAPAQRPTTEREVAVLSFALRFGAVAAQRTGSAHDTIYALDRFHAIVGAAIDHADGAICSRAGDRWMALFGLDGELADGCARALSAARHIEEQSIALCDRLLRELGSQVDFSLGLHAGSVVAGMVGEGDARTLTAVGEGVDASARLAVFAAQHPARFVISQAAARGAGIGAGAGLTWRAAEGDAAGSDALFCAESSAAAVGAWLAGRV